MNARGPWHSLMGSSTITLEYVVSLEPREPGDMRTAIAAFAFEEDAQKWMEQSRYGFDNLRLHYIPKSE